MARIIPTVGRVMHYRTFIGDPTIAQGDQPLAAIVTYVWNEDMVNLAVFDTNGRTHARTSVHIVQEGSPHSAGTGSAYAEWMDFQKGQAAKYEALAAERDEVLAG